MASIPLSIVKYIRSILMADLIITYLQIDRQGNLISWGGYPRHYGLSDLVAGQPVIEQVDFLDGLLDIPHTQVLQFICIDGGGCAHVHIVPAEEGTWVLLFDATSEHDQQQKMQQQVNELSILTYRQSQLLQELEMARKNLFEEKQKLEEASDLKSRFIATLSHELRTPLTSIVGYAKLLDEVQQADARETNYLTRVKNNANHLLGLIDNVLDQAQLEMGQVVLQPSNCNVKQLLVDLRSLFFPTAQEKKLTFETELSADVPAKLKLDELRFRQVLINLITNALKFTQQGFVRVTLSWQKDRLQFAVADSGPGISPTVQQKIFTAFHRENAEQTQSGAGLGLAISHHLINLMGGELTVESTLGQGSIFKGFIEAPLIQVTTSVIEHVPQTLETTATILIADDSIDIRTLMEIYLEEHGYRVLSASDGKEAVNIALQTQPNLILIDMHMPVINGYEAVKKLRAQNFTQPIIALSGSNLPQDQNYALSVGCDHYLIKPVVSDDLLEIIQTFLNRSHSTCP